MQLYRFQNESHKTITRFNLTLKEKKSIFNLNNRNCWTLAHRHIHNVTQNRREMKKISHVEEKNC